MATQETEPIYVRVSPELFRVIKKQAEANERSMNKEVVFCLKELFRQKEGRKKVC